MLLYELAITLDRRSTELVDAAEELGFGTLQAGSDLDAQQVAAIRAHFGGGLAPPPLAPLGSNPPLPAPPAAPLAFGPPPDAAVAPGGAPSAPASWVPPTAPSHWGPPPGAASPTPPSPPSPGALGWGAPDPAVHVGPAFAYPDSPIAPEAGAPAAAVFAPPPPDVVPAPPVSTSAGSGFGTGQKVVIGAVVLGVVALFGFMAMNTGPDRSRQQAMADRDTELEAGLNATTAPIAATTDVPATTTAPPTPSAYDVVDVGSFCSGGLSVSTMDLRLAAALADEDFAELTGIVRDRRAGWDDDMARLTAGAPPILLNDIELYRTGYDAFFDAVASSTSLDEAYSKVDRLQLAKAGNAGQEIGTQIANECD
ncbi:MAG: hypothetical protein ACTHN0_03055 [Aquihabitans sp.]